MEWNSQQRTACLAVYTLLELLLWPILTHPPWLGVVKGRIGLWTDGVYFVDILKMYYWVVICNYIVVIWHCNAVKTALFGVRNKLLGSFPFCSCFDSGWLLMLDGRKKEVMKMEWLHWLPTTSFKRTTNCSIRRGKEKWQKWQQQTTEPKSQGHDNGRKRSYGRERKPESHTRSRTNTWGHVKWLYTQEDRLWASTSTSSSWTLFATRIMDLLVLLWRLPFRLLDILKTRQDSISLR